MAVRRPAQIGLWLELARGEQWRHQGVFRVVGFIVQALALSDEAVFDIPVLAGNAAEIADDLASLGLQPNRHFRLHEWQPDSEARWIEDPAIAAWSESARRFAGLAAMANRLSVDTWWSLFPHYSGALLLRAPLMTLFPDAIPYDFPFGWAEHWENGVGWPLWRARVTDVLARSQSIITFSRHVVDCHLQPLFALSRDKIHVIPLAPPDLAQLIPDICGRRRTPRSRAAAADILRAHAEAHGRRYLQTFPFDQVRFVTSATQDRPTKNLGGAVELVRLVVSEQQDSLKVILTATPDESASWSQLPQRLAAEQLQFDVLSLPDLPRRVHAALIHCAAAVVHFSFYEGIVGALPVIEALSIGTPALIAKGPHTAELLERFPEFFPFVFDPYDTRNLSELLDMVLNDRDAVVAQQLAAYERMSTTTWQAVGRQYLEAAYRSDGAENALLIVGEQEGEISMTGPDAAIVAEFAAAERQHEALDLRWEAQEKVNAGDLDVARELVGRSLELNDRDPITFQIRGLALLRLGIPADAEVAARTAVALDGSDAGHRNLLAEILEELCRRKEAIDMLEEGLRAGVRNGQTYSLLGNFWQRERQLERAEAAFFEGTLVDTSRQDLAECLAMVRQDLNR